MTENGNKDEGLGQLLESDFDPIQYLNDALPSLNLTTQQSSSKQNRAVQLQTSAVEVQAHASRLTAYNTRTSTELTTLTDEILRSGNRLAYEVEVLRSDVNSLFDLLSETLRDDIRRFVREEGMIDVAGDSEQQKSESSNGVGEKGSNDPEFMQQIRVLGHVKARLEEIIQVFGNALKWPIPPSDVSMASQLISVSAPELGVVSSAEDDKARATIRQYREEIVDLLNSEGGGYAGLQAAQKRLEDFQNLAQVWKGTPEERPRGRVVDGFAKVVDERKRALDSQQNRRSHFDSVRPSAQPSRTSTPALPAGGLLGGLRKLRDEMYLD